MTWTAPAPFPPPEGPLVGPDGPMFAAYLAWQRYTLLNICAGLTGEQLATRSADPSNLSLLGLVRHLAKVERTWFRERLGGPQAPPMYDAQLGKDADFDDLDPARAEADFTRYAEECRLADAAVEEVPLSTTFELRGETYSLQFVYIHMTNEYGRHLGHADLVRERLDGVTGR